IHGVGLNGLKEPDDVIDAKNSGTTTRLLMGLLSGQPFYSVITGDDSLRRRPMKRVAEPLRTMGAHIDARAGGEYLPVSIKGGNLKGITYKTPVASAQLKSALLLAGLYAEGETIVEEPEKSRDHTERMLKHFGADIETKGNTVRIKKTKALKGSYIKVPGDISSAAFFMVASAITQGSELTIRGVGINPTRCGIINILEKMGASIEVVNNDGKEEPSADIIVKTAKLKGVNIGAKELLPAIDEFPIICVAAAFADGITEISGAAELRVKESDRIKVMAESLGAIGIKTEEKKDGLIIHGVGRDKTIKGGAIDSRGDHRIAMALAVAALKTDDGVTIQGSECVDVSFPGFFELLTGVAVR
ncbi:MAG: 3-phosphoshikimate 1-carboxyvinyltransferase, partial [Thermodesulfobacteriota bacterium]